MDSYFVLWNALMRSGFGDFFRGLPRSERNLQVEEIMMRTNSDRTKSNPAKSNRANSRRTVLSLASLIALHWLSLASGQETESKTPAKNPTGVSLGEAKLAGDVTQGWRRAVHLAAERSRAPPQCTAQCGGPPQECYCAVAPLSAQSHATAGVRRPLPASRHRRGTR